MNIVEKVAADRGIPLVDVAALAGVRLEAISGQFKPDTVSPKALEILSDILGVDSSALYAERLPTQRSLPVDFRTAQNERFALTKESLKAIYRTNTVIDYVETVSKALNEQRFNNLNKYLIGNKSDALVKESLNNIFSLKSEDIIKINDPYQVFNLMRLNVEKNGAIVLIDRVRDKSLKGFCINTGNTQCIFLNSQYQNYRSRIFTLVHETIHLIIKKPGISDPYSDRLNNERRINRIAAEYLIDQNLILNLISSSERGDDPIALVDYLYENVPLSKFFLAIRVQEVSESYSGFASRWLKATGIGQRKSFNSSTYTVFLDSVQDEDERSDASEDGSEFTPRATSASYQVSRLGYTVLSLIEVATTTRATTKFDLQHFLRLPAKHYEKVISSYRRKKSEVAKYASD